MAQTAWINLMVDTNTTDPSKARHVATGGLNNGSADVTFAYDPLKLATANAANSVLDEIRRRVIGGTGLK